MLRGATPGALFHTPYEFQISAEEILENRRAEAALKPGVVWSKDTVRLCIPGETNYQVCSRVDEFATIRFYRLRPSVVQDSIEGQVSGDLVISLSYIEPKAIKGE